MRLLVVTHYFVSHRSGVEIVADRLIAEWLGHGVSVTWIASNTTSPPEARSGLSCVPMPTWNFTEDRIGVPYPLWSPGGLCRLWRAVAVADAVVLHDTLYFGNVMAAIFARLRGKPLAVIQHIGSIPYENRLLRFIMTLANRVVAASVLRTADRVSFISETTRAYFERFVRLRKPGALIFNGVDTRLFRPAGSDTEGAACRKKLRLAEDRPICLFVGRFVARKGLAILRDLAESMPNVQWLLAGWGPIEPRDWNCPNVAVLNDRAGEGLRPLYLAADLFVLPSVGEGFPLVVQEALASGLPVLCNADTAEGAPEALPYLYREPIDSGNPDATARRWRERIDRLLSDRAGLARLGSAAASFAAEHWSWDAKARLQLDMIQNAVADRTRPVT